MDIFALGLSLLAISWMGTIIFRLQLKANRLGQLAVLDGLTGLYQHREINRLLHEAVARAYRRSLSVSVIMLDVDHFKLANDTHGHGKGDQVLRALGEILRANLELGDLIGRWGGEEFFIVLPGVTLKDAVEIAERLRQVVAGQKLAGLNVTISLGVACRIGDAEALFREADAALYRAKASGRNCVGTLD